MSTCHAYYLTYHCFYCYERLTISKHIYFYADIMSVPPSLDHNPVVPDQAIPTQHEQAPQAPIQAQNPLDQDDHYLDVVDLGDDENEEPYEDRSDEKEDDPYNDPEEDENMILNDDDDMDMISDDDEQTNRKKTLFMWMSYLLDLHLCCHQFHHLL